MISLQNIISRNCGVKISAGQMKKVRKDEVLPVLCGQEDLALSGKVSKEAIDFLTRQIKQVENYVEDKVELKAPYHYLQTICGVGKILSLTIMLETGPIERFAKVGNYTSYCRKVPTKWTSNEKTKGKGNKKNGNKYLAWAFSEAAELARRYEGQARAYYNKKSAKTNFMVAHTALAHKLARAAYFVMRDQVPFDPIKVFV
jgi:transposase